MNKPYIKSYDNLGLLVNEIKLGHSYPSLHPNRKQRREALQKKVFIGNHKGISLSVIGQWKYKRVVQIINGKRILHQLPC